MLELIVNKTTNKATVTFDGKEQELNIVKVNKDGVKPGTHWINMQPLGTPKKWATVNYNNYEDDVFAFSVDEQAHRVVMAKINRSISINNIKDFLTEEQGAQFDELYAAAQAECSRRIEAQKAAQPVKEKKSRAMTPEQKLAKALAEAERLKKVIAGEIEDTPKKTHKTKKDIVVEDLDEVEATESSVNDFI